MRGASRCWLATALFPTGTGSNPGGPAIFTLKVSLIAGVCAIPVVPDLGDGLRGCYRCGYVWRPRKSPLRICPRCKSKYWDTPPVPRVFKQFRKHGLGLAEVIGPRADELKTLAAQFGGYELRVFGSVARGQATAVSDVDILLRFRRPLGLLARSELRERAALLLGRRVDVATESNLHWLVRPRVLSEAIPF